MPRFMISGDTIAAISSAVGPAPRIIVRASGPQAARILSSISSGATLEPAAAVRRSIAVGDLAFPAWVYTFVSPHSYTGEDLVELHVPGNPLLARLTLEWMVRHGARQAEAGEFTARAYFNGRIDLTEAEGVAASIHAQNEQELRAARQLLAGELSRRVREPMDLLAETLALVEVGIDFVDEDVTFLSVNEVRSRIGRVRDRLEELVRDSARFERLSHEPQIVLVGRPNAGKSTLLNALAGHERAVVSPIAGTTRDALSADVTLPRGLVRVIDVAGLEEAIAARASGATSVTDDIARQMRRQAMQHLEQADLVVLVRDVADERPMIDLPRNPDLVVLNKIDLAPASLPVHAPAETVKISASTGSGVDELRNHLDELAFGKASATTAAGVALNARHVQAIAEAFAALDAADARATDSGPEVVAMELREALDALGRILGSVSPDDLLGRIFSAFCIGK